MKSPDTAALLILSLLGSHASIHAESLAGVTYNRTTGRDFSFASQYEDFAGLTFNALTRTYFMTDSNKNAVLEIDGSGNLLRTIDVTNLKRTDVTDTDPEGITWMYGFTYAITMEKGEELAIVTINGGTTSIQRAQASIYDLSGDPKGVTYKASDDTLNWISETNPPRVVKARINPLTGNLDQLSNIDVSALPVVGLGDVAYFPRLSPHLLLLSNTGQRIMEVDLTSGAPVLRSSFSLASWPIPNAHGFAFGQDGKMRVVGKHVAETPEDDYSEFTPATAFSNQVPIPQIAGIFQ